MPPPWPSASATATRFATHWIADALAGDESIQFAVLQELLRASSNPLAGAPEATRERVALRSLQELLSVIAAGGDAAAPTAGLLRVDGAQSCEGVVSRIIREVESSGKIETDLLPPFSQDIQETICTKKLALPETSFQLLKGVDPWITSMTPQSQLEHNGTEQCDNDQSLRNSHEFVNIEKPVFPTDNAEVQQETMANLIKESETGNLQKGPSAPTSVLHQPCTPETRSCVPPREDTLDAVGLGTRSLEKSPIVEGNMSVGSVLASAGCDAPLQGTITEPFPQQDKHDHTATVEPKSFRQKSPNLPDSADGLGADDGGSSNQSSKVSSHEGPNAHATVTPGFDRISVVLPTDVSEPEHLPECITAQDTTMSSQPDSRKAHLSALQHERGERVNQDLEDVCASIRPVEKDHVHGDLTLLSSSVLLSTSCNGANQGSKSETNLQPGTATEDRMASEEQNADKSHLEVSGANNANRALHDGGSIMKNNTVHGGLTAQTAPVSQNCNVTLQDKTSEDNCFSEQKNEKDRTDVQKDNCRTSSPSSSKDRDGKSTKKTSDEEKSEDTSPEICVRSKDQDIDDTLEGLSQQDLCIKCGKDGQLLKCGDCLLAAHDTCFGSSLTFEETNLFYCPVCFYKKATEAYKKAKTTYSEARKNLAAFIGTTQTVKQHDEQLTGVQPGAAKRGGHSNGSDMSKRNSTLQNEAYDIAHRDEEPRQLRKKQKINAKDNGYPKEVLTEKVPFQNSDPASMNKHSVLQNNSKTQVKDPEKKQQAGDKEACKEAGNDNYSNGPDMPKRNSIHQNEAYDLAHRDEEPDRQRKKQKINARGHGSPKEVLIEKVPFQNSGPASMNKHSVLQNNSKTQLAGDKETRKEAGNDTSSHGTRASSPRRCDPPSNQDSEADQEDGLTASNQSVGSDELEATSSNDSGKRPPPPWRNMRHSKKRLQEKEPVVSSKSRKGIAKQDQHMPTSRRKRGSIHPQKRYSNPVAPAGRRAKLAWTEKEVAMLREAMAKFTPQDNSQIPWIQIREYGNGVFHKTRLPDDLRVKWRILMKKECAGY